MVPLAYLAFFLICAALMTLAFRPAWQEWRSPTDCSPLPISTNYTTQVEHFAEQFHQGILPTLAAMPGARDETFEYIPADVEEMDWPNASKPLIAFHPLSLPRSVKCPMPLYVSTDLDSIGHDTFIGVFAAGNISLGPHSEIREWAHAEGEISLGVSCVALRRVSSGVAIRLKEKCCFERLNAPIIHFGAADAAVAPKLTANLFARSFASLPGAIRRTDDLYMVKGDCVLPRHQKFNGSLIVTGRLIVGAFTIVEGDIKARKGLSLGTEASVSGSVVSEGEIKIFERVRIGGLVISEASVLIGKGSIVGSLERPSTISAETVIVESGSIAHGTVWARDVGTVWSA